MLRFDEESHSYTEDGKRLISVTQLMEKHRLSPDYGDVPEKVLEEAAMRGKVVHKEIEEWIKKGEDGLTAELDRFRKWVDEIGAEHLESEVMMSKGNLAGTADLFFRLGEDTVIADIKTTSSIHMDAVEWQLSLYNYLADWRATQAMVLHFDKKGRLDVKFVYFKPMPMILELLKCEEDGKIYGESAGSSLDIPSETLIDIKAAESIIAQCEAQIAQAKETEKRLKKALLASMVEAGVKKWENDDLLIFRKAEAHKALVDRDKLEEEYPEAYANCLKESVTPETVVIKLKGKKQ